MKSFFSLLLATVLCLSARADGKGTIEWPAIKAFHTVMSQTFHPSEEGNLQPIRTRAGELVEKAQALTKGAVPAQYDTPQMRDAIKRLQTGSKEVQTLVTKKASDEELKTRLASLHDTFHEIVGLCRNGDGHEEGGGEGHGHEGHSHEGHNHEGHSH